MSSNQLYEKLKQVTASRESRLEGANFILNQPELLPDLLAILFNAKDPVSGKAAWILEFACITDISIITPYLNTFTANLNKLYLDASVRSVAKICELLAKSFHSENSGLLKQKLLPEYKQRIITICFDYLIKDKKTAPKAYAMTTLFLFGQDYKWIHPELKVILERDFNTQSAGFKARAKPILKQLKHL